MTLTLATLSAAGDPASRRLFADRFSAAAAELWSGEHGQHPPSAAYTQLVLSLAAPRRSELFMVLDGDSVVARALIAESLAHSGASALGLFEAGLDRIDRAGEVIIDAALKWARANALPEIFAPLDVNTWLSYRFPVHEKKPAGPPLYSWEPAQPPEYRELFQRLGFEEAERYHTIGLHHARDAGLADGIRQTEPARAAAELAGYRFEQLGNADDIGALIDDLHPLCMDAFRDNPLFEPVPLEVFRRLQMAAAATRDCSLSHVVRHSTGALAGFVFVFMDDKDVVIKTIAVRPEARGRHVSTALIHAVLTAAAERGYETIVSALVREGNTSEFLSRRHMHEDVTTWRRDYVLLRRRVEE